MNVCRAFVAAAVSWTLVLALSAQAAAIGTQFDAPARAVFGAGAGQDVAQAARPGEAPPAQLGGAAGTRAAGAAATGGLGTREKIGLVLVSAALAVAIAAIVGGERTTTTTSTSTSTSTSTATETN